MLTPRLAHHRCVVECIDGVGGRAAAVGVEELEGHDLRVPVHARRRRRRCSPTPAMVPATCVPWLWSSIGSLSCCEILAVYVVDEAVAVVVDVVAGDLAGIVPHVGGEVGVVVVDAGVDHADDDRSVSSRLIPRLGQVGFF